MRRAGAIGKRLDPPGLAAWDAWHPSELLPRLQSIEAAWHVAGGWALDLWHGFETRRHEDIEIAIIRSSFGLFRSALPEMQFFSAGDGQVHPLLGDDDPPESVHQVWCLDTRTHKWKLDIMLEPGTSEQWVFRRDRRIWRLRAQLIGRTRSGVPYLKPAGVLLFKAKHLRVKDELDFENAVGKLEDSERVWLKNALLRVHPGHPWIGRL